MIIMTDFDIDRVLMNLILAYQKQLVVTARNRNFHMQINKFQIKTNL